MRYRIPHATLSILATVTLVPACADRQESPLPPNKAPGEVVMKAQQASVYLEIEPVKVDNNWCAPITLYGRVVPNPAATVEVHAPFAGTLRSEQDNWPAPGKLVNKGTTLGWLDARVAPEDLEIKLKESQLKLIAAQETSRILEARLRRLEAVRETVSKREIEDDEARLIDAKAQEQIAQATVTTWEQALARVRGRGPETATERSALSFSVTVPLTAEVIETPVRPGMAVESGTTLLVLVDFNRPLVRLDIPPQPLAGQRPPATIELAVVVGQPPALSGIRNSSAAAAASFDNRRATLVGPAGQVDLASQMAGYFYQVDPASGKDGVADNNAATCSPWRPGMFIKADIPSPGGAGQEAVSVPDAAVLIHQGRTLIYEQLKSSDEQVKHFKRQEVEVLGPRMAAGFWPLVSTSTRTLKLSPAAPSFCCPWSLTPNRITISSSSLPQAAFNPTVERMKDEG